MATSGVLGEVALFLCAPADVLRDGKLPLSQCAPGGSLLLCCRQWRLCAVVWFIRCCRYLFGASSVNRVHKRGKLWWLCTHDAQTEDGLFPLCINHQNDQILHTQTHIYRYIYISIYMCVHIFKRVYIYIYMCVCIYIFMYICISIYIYIYICISVHGEGCNVPSL